MSVFEMIDGDDDKNAAIQPDEENAPVEIEIADEDLSTSEASAVEDAAAKAAAAAEEAKKHNRVPAEKRIGKLTREKKEALEYADKLKRELEEARKREAEFVARADKADKAMMIHYEKSVAAQLAQAKHAYSEALASGDPDKIADANLELSKYANEKNEIDRWKSRQPKEEAQPEQRRPVEERQPEQQQQRPNLAPAAAKWATETSWFNPESDGFNEDMHLEAVSFAQQLERRFARQGRTDEIGVSEAYFKAIEDHVRSEFPDEFDDVVDVAKANGRTTPAMNGGRPDTAPAVRNGSPGVGGTPGMKVALSRDDRDMARRFMAQGFFKDKNGKPIKDEGEAMKAYALLKWKDEQAERAKQKLQ